MNKLRFVISLLIVFSSVTFAEEFETCYINVHSDDEFGNEYFLISQIKDLYFVSFLRPTESGRKSLSKYWIGHWDGSQLILENEKSIYAIKKLNDGNIFFYVIDDIVDEFPGITGRPLNIEDLISLEVK